VLIIGFGSVDSYGPFLQFFDKFHFVKTFLLHVSIAVKFLQDSIEVYFKVIFETFVINTVKMQITSHSDAAVFKKIIMLDKIEDFLQDSVHNNNAMQARVLRKGRSNQTIFTSSWRLNGLPRPRPGFSSCLLPSHYGKWDMQKVCSLVDGTN
jgi:hypothetical protein